MLEASPESRTALVSQDPAAILHHRRRRKATCTKTTQHNDTICVEGVAERTPGLSRRHSACVPPAGVKGITMQRHAEEHARKEHQRHPKEFRLGSDARA
jgi:hypothetical protein